MPIPSALVKKREHPAVAVSLRLRSLFSTIPVTARPKIGSGESILCPPARGIPASSHTERPPSITSRATSSLSFSIGQPKIAIAISGLPPIAYISLIAFVAAIRPKVKGSSTIGIKKSVVLSTEVPLPRSNAAASSFVLFPTSNAG